MQLNGFHSKSNIEMIERILHYFSTSSSFYPHFPQKRAKKLEGETIYIRHSNLMLEVCIVSLLISVMAVCCHIFLPAWTFVLISFLVCHLCFSYFLALFQLDPKGLACTVFLSDSHASSLFLFWPFYILIFMLHIIGKGLLSNSC